MRKRLIALLAVLFAFGMFTACGSDDSSSSSSSEASSSTSEASSSAETDDDHGDDEDGVRVSGANASIAVVEMVEEEDDDGHDDHDHGDEHGDKVLQIVGVSNGTTYFKLELMNGDHADYTSANLVPVVVK